MNNTVIGLTFFSVVCIFLFAAAILPKKFTQENSESELILPEAILSEAIPTHNINPPKPNYHQDDNGMWDIHGVIEDYEVLPAGDNNSYPIFILHFKDGRIIPMVIQGDSFMKGVEITIYYRVWARDGKGGNGSYSRLGNFAYEIRVEQ